MQWNTRAKTTVSIPAKLFWKTNFKFNLYVKQRFAREYILHFTGLKPADLADETLNNYMAMYHNRMVTKGDDRLPNPAGWITQRMLDQTSEGEIKARSKELLNDQIVSNPMVGGSPRAMVTKLVYDALRSHARDVRTVCNIGALVDTQCAYLAPRFPNIEFTSVDRFTDLARMNSFLPQSPNWKFRTGYALELLETGSLAADLFFMTSTSVCFSPRELDAYTEQIARSCRFVIFNEPWWPSLTSLNFFKIPRPEEIQPGHALIGLAYFNFQSNYIYALEKHGFDVLISRIVPTAGGPLWYTLQIVAERVSDKPAATLKSPRRPIG